MALETASYINGLVATNPTATDTVAQADDHIRLIKAAIKATLPNISGAVTASHTELNVLDGITATTGELNALDGIVVGSTQLNYLYNATGNIQGQINTINADISTLTSNLNSVDTDLVNDTSPQLGGDLNTNGNAIAFGSWTIETNGTSLSFYYNNTERFRLGSTGSFSAEGDIGAFVSL